MLGRLAHRIPTPIRQRVREAFFPEILPEGETAPDWTLRGHDGEWYTAGDDWSVLVFYPADETPGCTAQLREFEAHREQFDAAGCRIFGVNPADAASHAAFAAKEGLGFPLLVDEGGAVAEQFRAVYSLPLSESRIIRTVYLVNPKRKIRLANRGAPSVPAILRSIRALQSATKTGM